MKKCKVINRLSCTGCSYIDDEGEFGGRCERPKNTYCRGMWIAQDRNAVWDKVLDTYIKENKK